ncbi:alpha/beta hydrolase [Alsobacter sp. SYSU M60028]|uniref:Alpha/beta hydrolase n=1 Tax=Alsobacter ponti TaxID=2962936 RepID=A0ABT1L800_9HYPH|nr:alpha/beta hydrolase [Alsobacter ponti]MCP8937619.1 alpha/beta hydrolase [Alsobacter ponti]
MRIASRDHVIDAQPSPRPLVVAFHCSGATGRQWNALRDATAGFDLFAPDLTGATPGLAWSGHGPFDLLAEAAEALATIDRHPGCVHLVGHSYGGGVALAIAARRPEKVASLSLYEPSAFHVLRTGDARARRAWREIAAVASATVRGVATGDYEGAADRFVTYWAGPGAWSRMKPAARDATRAAVPSFALHFHALTSEPTPLAAYGAFGFPVLVMRGDRSPLAARTTADILADAMPRAARVVLEGWDHLAPLTASEELAAMLARFIRAATLSGDAGGCLAA